MKTIMIVDDSKTARMFVRRCLEIAGCREALFTEAANGKEALALLKERPADFVVVDLNMPVMDGKMTLKWIKASPRLHETPVVVVTSASNPVIEAELIAMGAYAVMSKPVSPPQLIASIGSLLGVGEVTNGMQ